MQHRSPDPALQARLDDLATQLTARAPHGADGQPADLVGLLPCEPVIGDVAVACWVAGDGGEQYDLVRLADGTAVHDHTALREALTLLAMTETLEELVGFEALAVVSEELHAWRAHRSADTGVDAAEDEALLRALDAGTAALGQLRALGPGGTARVARTAWLDAVGAAHRALESRWTELERAAERWSDAQLAPDPNALPVIQRVQTLWSAMGAVRQGPLARPASSAIHEGREAGSAMAAAIAEAAAAQRP